MDMSKTDAIDFTTNITNRPKRKGDSLELPPSKRMDDSQGNEILDFLCQEQKPLQPLPLKGLRAVIDVPQERKDALRKALRPTKALHDAWKRPLPRRHIASFACAHSQGSP